MALEGPNGRLIYRLPIQHIVQDCMAALSPLSDGRPAAFLFFPSPSSSVGISLDNRRTSVNTAAGPHSDRPLNNVKCPSDLEQVGNNRHLSYKIYKKPQFDLVCIIFLQI